MKVFVKTKCIMNCLFYICRLTL